MTIKALALSLCALLAGGRLAAQERRPTWEAVRLADGLFELRTDGGGYVVKVLASIGPDGVLLVDSGQRRAAADLLETLRRLGGGVPRIVVNSHSHQEHVAGNLGLGQGPLVVGHARLRERLTQGALLFAGYDEDSLPRLTVTDELAIRFNGDEIRVKAFPGAHDDCDLVVHFTRARVAFVGALVTAVKFPSVDSEGDALRYPEISRKVLDWLPPDVRLVPGHGEDATVAQGREFVEMLEQTTALVRAELARGQDLEAMRKQDLLARWASCEVSYVKRDDWLVSLVEALTRPANPGPRRPTVHEPLHEALEKQGPSGIAPAYDELRRRGAHEIDDLAMAEIGYVLWTSDRIADAVPFFELSLRDHPRGRYANLSHRYLARIRRTQGDRAGALHHYRKALEADPADERARRELDEL